MSLHFMLPLSTAFSTFPILWLYTDSLMVGGLIEKVGLPGNSWCSSAGIAYWFSWNVLPICEAN